MKSKKVQKDLKKVTFPILEGAMAEKGLTRERMASIIGISISAFQAKINGKRSFSLEECGRISKYFNITLDELFWGKK